MRVTFGVHDLGGKEAETVVKAREPGDEVENKVTTK
jgi:hypothetical protein